MLSSLAFFPFVFVYNVVIYVVVQFYPWFKFYSLLFMDNCFRLIIIHYHINESETMENKI